MRVAMDWTLIVWIMRIITLNIHVNTLQQERNNHEQHNTHMYMYNECTNGSIYINLKLKFVTQNIHVQNIQI